MNWSANKLHVLYDGSCPLCIRSAMWLASQIKHTPIVLISAQDAKNLAQYDHVNISDPPEDLVVITDDNQVYRNDEAFLMCLYMLRNYRHWAKNIIYTETSPTGTQGLFLFVS